MATKAPSRLRQAIERVSAKLDRLDLPPSARVRQPFSPVPSIERPMDLAPLVDHTLLRADATREDLRKLCDEARSYSFGAVCVNSRFVEDACHLLEGSPTVVAAVVGFPLGASLTKTKAQEAALVTSLGAREIDVVMSIGALREHDYIVAHQDLVSVIESAGDGTVKAIIEAGLLAEDERIAACVIAERAGADFVKTSTGFAHSLNTGRLQPLGATRGDVELMRATVGDRLGVKAAGGIREYTQALVLIQAGATRIGSSSSVAIVTTELPST